MRAKCTYVRSPPKEPRLRPTDDDDDEVEDDEVEEDADGDDDEVEDDEVEDADDDDEESRSVCSASSIALAIAWT